MGSIRVRSLHAVLAFVFFGMILSATAAHAQLCSPGFYNPNGGLAAGAIACPAGTYSAVAGATSPTSCTAGFYQPATGQSVQIAAPIGFYVPIAGASSVTPAPAGSFVATLGSSSPTLCTPGFYTSIQGASQATPASPGNYVAISGATSQTPASPGSYVSGSAATGQSFAPPGSYAAGTGNTSPTLCQPGFFTANSGSSAPTPAAPGTYVAISGASSPTPASPGSFVSSSAAISQTPAPRGYYVPISGATFATPAGIGFFVPTVGAASQTVDPNGTTTPHTASFAPRSSSSTAPRGSNFIVGPIYNGTPTPTIDLTTGPAALTVKNLSTDLGFQDTLTALTLISAVLSGPEQAAFQINGFVTNTVLFEQGTSAINLSMVNPGSLSPGLHTATLTVQTDQSAAYGSPGDAFSYTVQFNAVPEPASLGLVGGMMLFALRRSRRSVK